jgi:nitroreductase
MMEKESIEHQEVRGVWINMVTKELKRETLHTAVEKAGRAPSLHNSQPWRFALGTNRVELYADYNRWLPSTDADGRDVLVSCGAALHHLRLALAGAGMHASVHRLPTADDPNHLATINVTAGEPHLDSVTQLLAAVGSRRTDRRPFRDWPIPETFVQQLIERAAEQGAVLRLISGTGTTSVLLDAVAAAGLAQANIPGYEAELASWTGRAGDDGIPASNLPGRTGTGVVAERRFTEGLIKPLGTTPDAATFLVLGTASDDRLSQLRAGEALSAVLLQATEFGLATCPLSQPLEVGSTRDVLRDDVLDGTLSPQIILRLGWAPADSPLPHTPRRPLDDILR